MNMKEHISFIAILAIAGVFVLSVPVFAQQPINVNKILINPVSGSSNNGIVKLQVNGGNNQPLSAFKTTKRVTISGPSISLKDITVNKLGGTTGPTISNTAAGSKLVISGNSATALSATNKKIVVKSFSINSILGFFINIFNGIIIFFKDLFKNLFKF